MISDNFIFSFLFLCIAMLLLTLSACSTHDNKLSACNDVACTEEYRSLAVTIHDPSGMPVVLKTYEIRRNDTGELLHFDRNVQEAQIWNSLGKYLLLDDSFSMELRNKQIELEFTGFVNETVLVKRNYLVGADFSHVLWFKGDLQINL